MLGGNIGVGNPPKDNKNVSGDSILKNHAWDSILKNHALGGDSTLTKTYPWWGLYPEKNIP